MVEVWPGGVLEPVHCTQQQALLEQTVHYQHDFCFVPFRTLIRTIQRKIFLGRTSVVKQASIFLQ
jgi:hypothetical protein